MSEALKNYHTIISEHPWTFLALFSAIGFFLRVRRIRKKGLFLWDEAAYYREALLGILTVRFYRMNWRRILDLRKKKGSFERTEFAKEYKDYVVANYAYYKPWHLYLNAIAVSIIKQRDVAVVVPSLLLGTATIPVVYLIGKALFPAQVDIGLAAALLMSVSGFHILHSRSAEPEPGTTFCSALGFLLLCKFANGFNAGGAEWFYSTHSMLMLIACGVCFSGALMFNPAWLPVFPAICFSGFAALAFTLEKFAFPFFPISIAVVGMAAALTILVTDIPFIINYVLLPESEVVPHCIKMRSYFLYLYNGLRTRLGSNVDLGVEIPRSFRFLFYPDLLLKTEGVVVILAAVGILAGVCIVSGVAGRTGWIGPVHDFVLASLIAYAAVILGLLTFVPQKAARGAVILLPPVMLLAAIGIRAFPGAAAAVVCAWCFLRGVRYGMRVGGLTSGIRSAVEYIRSQGEERIICTSKPFSFLYGPDVHSFYSPHSYESLRTAWSKMKIPYLIVDHHEYFPALVRDRTMDIIYENLQPVFKAKDPCVTFFPLFAEVEYYSPSPGSEVVAWNRFRQHPSERDRCVRVYRLNDFFLNTDTPRIVGEIQFLQASVLYGKGRLKEAVMLLKKSLRNIPGNPMPKYYLGLCYRQMGQSAWAARVCREALEEENLPKEVHDGCQSIVLLSEAEELVSAERFADAVPKLTGFLAILPGSKMGRFYLAASYFNLRRISESKELLSSLLSEEGVDDGIRNQCREILEMIDVHERKKSELGDIDGS